MEAAQDATGKGPAMRYLLWTPDITHHNVQATYESLRKIAALVAFDYYPEGEYCRCWAFITCKKSIRPSGVRRVVGPAWKLYHVTRALATPTIMARFLKRDRLVFWASVPISVRADVAMTSQYVYARQSRFIPHTRSPVMHPTYGLAALTSASNRRLRDQFILASTTNHDLNSNSNSNSNSGRFPLP